MDRQNTKSKEVVKARREQGIARTKSLESHEEDPEAIGRQLAKVLCADSDGADPDWDVNLLQHKLELSLKGLLESSNSKAGTVLQRILRPNENTIKTFFQAWKRGVHGEDDESSIDEAPAHIVPARKNFFPIHPHGAPRVMLDVLGMLVIFYDMIAIPLYLAFSQPPGYVIEEPWILGTFTRLFWTFECVISFNTGYFSHFGDLVLDRSKCVMNHFKTWFIVDLLTVGVDWTKIFLDFLMRGSGGLGSSADSSMEAAQLLRMMRIARIIRMLRLLRVLKLKKLIHTFYDRLLWYNEGVQLLLNIVQMLGMVLILIHSVGCMWYGFSVSLAGDENMTWVEYYLVGKEGEQTSEAQDSSLLYHYFTALHWALAQVSPGNIDIMPMNWKERVMNIFVLCLTLIVFSSFISSMTVAVTRLRNLHGSEDKRFALLRKYFRDNKTPQDLAVRVQTFLEEKLSANTSGTNVKDVDLLPLLSKGLYSELIRVRQEPILRSYMIFRKLHSSEAADDLLALICEEACCQRVYGPGEKIYIVDEMSKGMYFLTKGDFELREYREDDVKAFKISPLKDLTTSKPGAAPLPREGWTPTAPLPSYKVGWLSEFALFEPRHHDTMLFARAYCEILQVSRTSFLPVIRKFPTLEEVLIETNLKRYEHAEFLMGDEENIGDWIRPQAKQDAVELRVTDNVTRSSPHAATMPVFTPLMAAAGA